MANDQDKNNTEDLEKMIRDIVEEVFKDFEMPEKDTDEEE